jgi:N-sulfoglucosamine sulfohydrolase
MGFQDPIIIPFMNILYIHSHDTGRTIQPYGYPVPTPHLQSLAEEGVLFRQAYNASPTCTPSRAALLTGQYPHSCGMFGLAHRGFALAHPDHHLAAFLGRQGYRTVLAGMQHEAIDPHTLGYAEVLPTATRHAADVGPAAVRFLTSGPRQPFFLSVGFEETHRPYAVADPAAADPASAGPGEDPRYCQPPALFPDRPETRQDMANFKASARLYDQAVGEVLAALDETGLAEDTLVVSTTDHGLAFPRMKCNLNTHGMGVMLILRGPGGFMGGKVIDGLVSQLDLFPTLCEVAGLPAPDWLQGVSLLPLVKGAAAAARESVYGEINYHCVYEPTRSARTLGWNYIRRFQEYPHLPLPNCDSSPTKDLWVQNGWTGQEYAREELYDLTFDPQEMHNLASSPQHQAVLEEMRQRLLAWMEATADPLLVGPIPAPAGAELNPWDAASADDRNYIVG